MTPRDAKPVAILCLRASEPGPRAEGSGRGICAHCGCAVFLAPSSQRLIAKFGKQCEIICNICYQPSPNDTYGVAPGFKEEWDAHYKTKGPPS